MERLYNTLVKMIWLTEGTREFGVFLHRFANVDPDNQYPLEVRFLGNGIVPLAHFDLLPSDYLTGGRRATEMLLQADQSLPAGAKLDVSTKVVEFTSHALQPVKR